MEKEEGSSSTRTGQGNGGDELDSTPLCKRLRVHSAERTDGGQSGEGVDECQSDRNGTTSDSSEEEEASTTQTTDEEAEDRRDNSDGGNTTIFTNNDDEHLRPGDGRNTQCSAGGRTLNEFRSRRPDDRTFKGTVAHYCATVTAMFACYTITVDNIAAAFLDPDSRRPYIIYNAYYVADGQVLESILRLLLSHRSNSSVPGHLRKEALVCVSVHPTPGWNHLHIIHRCNYQQYRCRCAAITSIDAWRIRGRGWARPLRVLSAQDVQGLTKYHLVCGKLPVYCQTGEQYWGISDKDGSLPMDGYSTPGTEGLVEVCSPPVPSSRESGGRPHPDGTGESTSTPRPVGGYGRREDEVSGRSNPFGVTTTGASQLFTRYPAKLQPWQRLLALFKRFPHCPVDRIAFTSDWFNSDGCVTVSTSRDVMELAVRAYRVFINNMTILDLFKFQTSDQCTYTCV